MDQGEKNWKCDDSFNFFSQANLTEDPVEVFNYMFDIGVGLAVAQVYIEWATALERKGDLKRADAIYFEGLNRCTQFKDILKQSLL